MTDKFKWEKKALRISVVKETWRKTLKDENTLAKDWHKQVGVLGKNKAPAPATPSSPPRENPLASGSSLPAHPFQADAGFAIGEAGKGRLPKDHKLSCEYIDGLLVAGTNLFDRVDRVTQDLADIASNMPAMHLQMAELQNAHSGTSNGHAITDMLVSHNNLAGNLQQSVAAIQDITTRLLPSVFERIKALEAAVSKNTHNVDTLTLAAVGHTPMAAPTASALAATPAATAITPPAPGIDPTELKAVLDDYLASKGKHAREEDADATQRNVRARTQPAPEAFTYTPPSLPPPATAAYYVPSATMAPLPVIRPAPAAPLRAPPPRTAHSTSYPPSPACSPSRLAGRLPSDPSLQVIFGPISWTQGANGSFNVRQDIATLFADVLPEAVTYEFSTRRYNPNPSYTIVTFASAQIAEWIVDAWAQADRGTYTDIFAVHPNA
ncbi:hypothetical protein C8R45DRAFT_1094636 [Mycena sanguinolenta]|nr:hypothetical protein C8R45DRAFT_1094636 [Mycena sanguinolenta]